MFLVQLSHNTIKKEIESLNNKVERKKKALKQSSELLNEDEKIVRGFVEKDNDDTKKSEDNAERLQHERKRKEDELKEIDAQIQNLRSEFQKHQDTLESLQEHKNFLVELSDGLFNQAIAAETTKNKEEIKGKWIKDHKESNFEDYIIFAEEIQQQFNAYSKNKPRKGNAREANDFRFQRPKMTDDDWEAKFDYALDNFLIDVPPSFYSEKIQFSHPDEISDKFADLEEKNLFLIHQIQEIEQGFEELKSQEKIVHKELEKKKKSYQDNLDKLVDDLNEQNDEFGLGLLKSADRGKDDEDTDISELLEILRDKIAKTYKKAKSDNIDLSARSNIDMLSEIESKLDNQINSINKDRLMHEAAVKKLEGTIKKERKESKQKALTEKEQKDNYEKMRKASDVRKEKEGDMFKGRALMKRSKKKSIVKKVVKEQVDQHILDRKRYVGDID